MQTTPNGSLDLHGNPCSARMHVRTSASPINPLEPERMGLRDHRGMRHWRGGGGGHMVDGRDSARRNRAPGPHAHRNTARQAMDGLWTEACGQQKQSNDPANNQHILNAPTIERR